jgi:hypothetical protein
MFFATVEEECVRCKVIQITVFKKAIYPEMNLLVNSATHPNFFIFFTLTGLAHASRANFMHTTAVGISPDALMLFWASLFQR